MTKKVTAILLFLIFTLSFLIRFYRISALPIYIDETGQYHLLHKILMAETNPFSWFYDKVKWGSFTLVWLFGLNPLGVRITSVLYSSTLVFVAFFFSRKLTQKRNVTLLTALLFAIVPWNYMIGRIGHTSMPILLTLVLFSSYFFLRANNFKGYFISLFFLALAATYYPSMVIIAPFVLVLTFYWMSRMLPSKTRKKFYFVGTAFLVLLVTGTIALFGVLSPSERAFDLAIWRDVNTPYDTNSYRALSWNSTPSIFSFNLPPEKLANKLFLNRLDANLSIFTRNYLSFFSPEWLFLRGDAILRHSTGMVGEFYPFLLPFMIFGAYRFFRESDSRKKSLFLVWIIASPIPAALTKDGAGYLLRVITMLPFLTYFCALGIVESLDIVGKKWRVMYSLTLTAVALYSVWAFLFGYFHIYPALSQRSFEYGFKQLSDFQVTHAGKTMLILWDGYYEFGHFLFWQKLPYSAYTGMKISPIGIGDTIFWKTLPNLYFAYPKKTADAAEFIKKYHPDFLVIPDRFFVKYPEDINKLTKDKISEVLYPDQTTAFTIYTLK